MVAWTAPLLRDRGRRAKVRRQHPPWAPVRLASGAFLFIAPASRPPRARAMDPGDSERSRAGTSGAGGGQPGLAADAGNEGRRHPWRQMERSALRVISRDRRRGVPTPLRHDLSQLAAAVRMPADDGHGFRQRRQVEALGARPVLRGHGWFRRDLREVRRGFFAPFSCPLYGLSVEWAKVMSGIDGKRGVERGRSARKQHPPWPPFSKPSGQLKPRSGHPPARMEAVPSRRVRALVSYSRPRAPH